MKIIKKCIIALLLTSFSVVSGWTETFLDTGRVEQQSDIKKYYNTGLDYFDGKTVSANYAEALKWFQKSAQMGHVPSQKLIGEIYLSGRGIEIDFTIAYSWFKTASLSEENNDDLKTHLDLLGKCMTRSQLFEAERLADQLYEKINQKNCTPSATITNSLGLTFVYIKPGSFVRNGITVSIMKGYYMQTTEVTQAAWAAVMGETPWAGYKYVQSNPNNPAVYISWRDCKKFITKLNKKEGTHKYRLPTEAEWEYAARGGSTSAYCFGDDVRLLDEYAWYSKNTWNIGEKYAHAVGRKKPNQFGLYDMHGNVWEWCEDLYGKFPKENVADLKGPEHESKRVHRGGSWYYNAARCTSTGRYSLKPDYRYFSLGFRLTRSI